MTDVSKLSAEFPREAVHWRVQGTPYERNGTFAAMALAYIDARDVMDRLDAVCGPEGWQDSYEETASGRTICTLSVKIGDEWVSKSDGAGGTQVEAEKGGLSDALKRAAVKWGIGRYLYRLDSPWVKCEVRQKNGKTFWKKWAEDPWSKVKMQPYHQAEQNRTPEPEKPAVQPFDSAATRDRIKKAIDHAANMESLDKLWNHPKTGETLVKLDEPHRAELQRAYNERAAQVFQAPPAEKEEA